MYSLIFCLAFNLLMFVPAFIFKTDKLTDASYSLTFIALAVYLLTRLENGNSAQLLMIMIVMWAMRLGSFLVFRIWNTGRDKRFDEMRNSFRKFISFWILQGLSVFAVSLAVIAFATESRGDVVGTSLFGLAVFFGGLIIETIADLQKLQFTSKESNKGKWIDKGLWSVSRHPNYLGEMLVWIGVFAFVLPYLQGSIPYIAAALASPVYIVLLLMFVSGIPLLEKAADKKWGSDPKYVAYKKRVPALIPKLW